jgi:hypothetical protein
MPRESGASSNHQAQWILDHPPSRMMTTMFIGAALPRTGLPTSRQFIPGAVAIFAAHHMMDIIQKHRRN